MNGIERLHIQLTYLWLGSFVRRKSGKPMDENDFEIPIARFSHFVKMLNWLRIVYQEIVHQEIKK